MHPKIAIGIERFKKVRGVEFLPNLFDRDRFFDFRPDDTNTPPPTFSPEKYDAAEWVGDKVPHYYRKARPIFARFPGARMIYILRDIDAVAASWQARADKKRDSWPERNGSLAAVVEWNKANATALDYSQSHPDRFHVISYERMFSGSPETASALFGVLGLSLTSEIEAECSKATARDSAKPKMEGADRDLYRALLDRQL